MADQHAHRAALAPHHQHLPLAAGHHPQHRRRRRPTRPLPHAHPKRHPPPGPLKTQPIDQREVWLTAQQVTQLADAIHPHYHALVIVAAHTGLRFQELAALRWHDLDLRHPLDDGAIIGPGRLRVSRVLADPRRSGTGRDQPPTTPATKRTIALDQPTTHALRDHRQRLADDPQPLDLVFTTPPRGSRGGTPLAANNFARIWKPALPLPGSSTPGPATAGCTSTTCATPTRSG